MNVAIVSQADALGGAARAAYRLHRELTVSGIESRMRVSVKLTGDPSVFAPTGSFARVQALLRNRIGQLPFRFLSQRDSLPRNAAWLPSRLASDACLQWADVVNLHWVGHEFMSVADIGRISKPTVWTLHDMWAFCGAEHLDISKTDQRFISGYMRKSQGFGVMPIDLDRWTYRRKQKAWKQPRVIVTPSSWLASCVQKSALLGTWPVYVIPNPLPTDIFRPCDPALGRALFKLPADCPLILFGTVGGVGDFNKGADLLWPALRRVADLVPNCHAVVMGQHAPLAPHDAGMPIHYTGPLADEQSLALLYSAVDVVVIPSRIENLPQVGTEAQACGTPVVAFDTGGLSDVVATRVTGFLAKPYDIVDLAEGIAWVISDSTLNVQLGRNARQHAVAKWAPDVVLRQYLEAYAAAETVFRRVQHDA